MTATRSPLHQLAVATDTRLSDLYYQRITLGMDLEYAQDAVRRSVGQTKKAPADRYSREWQWDGTYAEALALAAESDSEWVKQALAKSEEKEAELAAVKKEIAELDAIYRQHLWSRFFLVQHIHSSMHCHTCYDSTQFGWLPKLSGLTEADAVEQEGEILCTVCFPSAPSEWTQGEGKRTKEAKAAAAAAKAERLAKKAEKSLSLDGSVIEIYAATADSSSRWKEFKTYRAAELWLVEGLSEEMKKDAGMPYIHYPDAWSDTTKAQVVALMGLKKGQTPNEILATYTTKAAARFKKEKAEYDRWLSWQPAAR